MKRKDPKRLAQRTICGNIASALAPDCSNPLVGALEVDFYLANKGDISSYTFNGSNALIIEAITMAASKKFYKYTGIKNSNNAKADLLKGKYLTNYEHTVEFLMFNVLAATKKELEALAQGLVVAIVEYKYKGASGGGAFEILGREQGLEVSVLSRDAGNNDTQGGYSIVLKTPDVGKEGHLPAPLFITSYAATAAVVAALIA